MFIQECFIRKNTKELQEKLDKLGYNVCICCNFNDARWLSTFILGKHASVHGVGYIDEENILMGVGTTEKCLDMFLSENENSIDCGENEELFLAIAALRDDNDYMQWFCDWDKRFWKCHNLVEEGKSSFEHGEHKSTVQELIGHFKIK